MNEQLQQALAELIQKSVDGIDKAAGFAVEQTPEVIQQLLVWEAKFAFAWSIVCLCFLGTILLAWIFMIGKNHDRWDGGDVFFSFIVAVGVCVPAGLGLAINATNYFKITMAPKVWLIEYAANLVK